MKTFIAILALAAVASAARYESEWQGFKVAYGKSYSDDEEDRRHEIFANTLDYVKSHNYDYSLGLTTFTLSINHMSDLEIEEVNAMYKGANIEESQTEREDPFAEESIEIPDHVDWRKKHVVTPVKNQQQCGSCWAFSVTGSIECIQAIKKHKLISLSEQNLVDCATPYGCEGCNGCWPENAFKYIIHNHGVDTEKSYPYTAQDGQCHFKKNSIGAKISAYKMLPKADEMALTRAIVHQPVSITIDAGNPSFQSYRSGIYYEPNCSQTSLDHCVLAVGYAGKGAQGKYYIVKNSWGTSWGNAGYIWMARDRDNNCGVAEHAIVPSL